MKTTLRSVAAYLLLVLVLPAVLLAQTISITSVSATTFCAGDPISVTFTTTGSWGHNNALTLQLSDANGSFTKGFTNLSSLFDTVGGTLTITSVLPAKSTGSTAYRVRVIGAVPFISGSDNGSDLFIGNVGFSLNDYGFGPAWGAGTETHIYLNDIADAAHDSTFWNFGSDATPASLAGKTSDPNIQTPVVMYSTGGMKSVTARVTNHTCSKDTTITKYVFDCTPPAIPHTALVISRDTSITWTSNTGPRSIWINPGVTVDITASSTSPLDSVFAEAGATITGRDSRRTTKYYLKVGVAAGSLKLSTGDVVIWQDAVALPNSGMETLVMQCPNLDFDYSSAPPNITFQPNAVAPVQPTLLQVLPNPTTASITITGARGNITNLEVYNALGQVVLNPQLPHSSNFSIDLSGLSNGTYYIRIVSGQGPITQKVVKN